MKKHFIIGMLLISSLAVSASEFNIGETVLRSRDTGQQEWSLATAEIVAQNGDILKLAEEKRMLNVQRDEVIQFKEVNAIKTIYRQVIKTGDVVLYKAFDYNDLLVKTVVRRLAKGDGNNLVEIDEEGVFYPARVELYKSVPSLTVNPLFSSSFVLNIGDKAIYNDYGTNVIVTVLDLTSNGYVQTTLEGYNGAYIPAKRLTAIKK